MGKGLGQAFLAGVLLAGVAVFSLPARPETPEQRLHALEDQNLELRRRLDALNGYPAEDRCRTAVERTFKHSCLESSLAAMIRREPRIGSSTKQLAA